MRSWRPQSTPVGQFGSAGTKKAGDTPDVVTRRNVDKSANIISPLDKCRCLGAVIRDLSKTAYVGAVPAKLASGS
jgi:hypothetical protein